MHQSTSRVRVEDIEQSIAQVGEIKAARVVVTSEGEIAEIHVLALPSKSPKQLVRDIESAIMASFGIPVDHRKISIAQLGSECLAEDGDVEDPFDATRLRIVSIDASVSGVRASASVTLEVGGREFIGMEGGPASQTGRTRFIALATLDAVRQYITDGAAFALEDVDVLRLGRERVAVACVSLVTPYGEQAFSGSAVVRNNENDSIVRATLDAINRRIGLLTTE